MNDRVAAPLVERPPKAGASTTDHAYVLHAWPWRETSAIVEVFTASHGRVGIIAKGAKRPRSAIRGVLQPFQPLTLNWFGKTDMKTLKSAEHIRFLPQLSGAALISAFYLNELVIKLTHREVPHEGLFEAYEHALWTLVDLGREPDLQAIAATLRRFEVRLTRELGYGLRFSEEAATHRAIEAGMRYWYVPERGAMPVERHVAQQSDAIELSGKTLIDMADDDYRDPVTLAESKRLMREIIGRLLGDKVLHSRILMRDIR